MIVQSRTLPPIYTDNTDQTNASHKDLLIDFTFSYQCSGAFISGKNCFFRQSCSCSPSSTIQQNLFKRLLCTKKQPSPRMNTDLKNVLGCWRVRAPQVRYRNFARTPKWIGICLRFHGLDLVPVKAQGREQIVASLWLGIGSRVQRPFDQRVPAHGELIPRLHPSHQ